MSKGAGYSRVHSCSALPGIGRVIWSSGLVQSPWEPESAQFKPTTAKQEVFQSPNVGASGTSAASNPVQQSSSPHPTFMSLLQSGVASQSTLSAEAAPPQDAAIQAGSCHVTRQGSIDMGSQGKGQSCCGD
ncbi:hypothetical protein EDB89DRAFT_1906369 [Lactarius sanguifluus]|nr:hypothetical protein EDB89DRAFT_1906369 [Lactarius sanguifluus]